jgi:hypothetical protein
MTEVALVPLEIPARVYEIAESRFVLPGTELEPTTRLRLDTAIEAAAPIAVAATIRKILTSDECWCHRCLRDLADVLDPEGEKS